MYLAVLESDERLWRVAQDKAEHVAKGVRIRKMCLVNEREHKVNTLIHLLFRFGKHKF